ncbi:MAG: VgrG-related protein [Anaerolineales bacterium]|nr:VgrG-related protein [Anaerolineales bacterium]
MSPDNKQVLASQIKVKVDGTELKQDVMDDLKFAQVDQHVLLPAMFMLTFLLKPDLKLLDGSQFDLGKEIEILSLDPDRNNQAVSLMKGEITAIEPSFGEGMIAELTVRGFDKSHRLFRETKSKSWLNVKDSDIASKVAGSAGLSAQVDATSQVFEHIFQHNQTDMEFLMQRAWRIGYECFVQEGKLYFRKPPTSGSGGTLTWGKELTSFDPRLSTAEQVSEVEVRGWDGLQKKDIKGNASSSQTNPQIGFGKWGGEAAQKAFGKGKLILVDQPVVSKADADKLAQARLDELNGAFVEADGECFRSPEVTAGKIVELKGLGKRFSGKYLLTNVKHTYSVERGFITTFHVRGTRTGLLVEQMLHEAPTDRWPAAVPAIVTNNDDPKKLGRVKVKFPWLDPLQESNWARVASAGAGKQRGMNVIPEVNDEVLVTFLFGDFDYPVVLGGLWNEVDELPPALKQSGVSGGKVQTRGLQSRVGHRILLYDSDNELKIEIISKEDRSISIVDKPEGLIEIKTKNSSIKMTDDKLNIKTQSDSIVDAMGNVKIKSASLVEIEGGTNLIVKSNANMKIEAAGNIDIQASGMVNIKGAMINLN